MRAIAAAAVLFASHACLAAATPAATPAAQPGSLGGQLAQMVLGLLLVVGLIFFLAWLLRRLQSTAVKGGQVSRLSAAVPSARVTACCWCRWARSRS